MLIPRPPPLRDMGLTHEVRVRFVANGAFSGNITYQNLLDIFNVASGATAAYDLFIATRVKFVEVWANALANASAVITLVYDGGTAGSVGDARLHTDASMGIEPAHIRAVPQPMTGAALYQVSSDTIAFVLVVPAGAVVDVSLSLRNAINGGQVVVQNAPAAATAGVLYVRGLDGLAVATSKFTPTGALAID